MTANDPSRVDIPLTRLRLIENAEPVLTRNLAHVLWRCDPLQRRNEIGIPAGVSGDGAASTDHVQPDRNMVCAYGFYDVIHMFRPLIGRRNSRRGLWVLPPFGLHAPTLSRFLVHARDEFATIAGCSRKGRLIADHICRRLGAVGRLFR